MNRAVSLAELVDEMEIALAEYRVFVHRHTGEVYGTTEEFIAMAEAAEDASDMSDSPQWQQEQIAKIEEIIFSPDWREVPQRSSSEDYSLMERFSRDACSGRVQEELLESIRGSGAFGRFKRVVELHGLLNDWHEFKRLAIAAELAAWLQSEKIEFRAELS